MIRTETLSIPKNTQNGATSPYTYWRVEGSLLDLSAFRPVAFFGWNAQSFSERWTRRGELGLSLIAFPLLYCVNRSFAARSLHILLRGISQDRLDLLGEEYFQYVLKPRLKARGVEKLREITSQGARVVLVSHGLNHVVRPVANFLGVDLLLANRLEFRDGIATGRLLEPVVPPRGLWAGLVGRSRDGRISKEWVSRNIRGANPRDSAESAIAPARRTALGRERPLVLFDSTPGTTPLSVLQSLRGKHILLIGVTGFIAKVWLIHLLSKVPEIGKIYLLIRRQGKNSGARRFERIVQESPSFDGLYSQYGDDLVEFLRRKVEVVEGDLTEPGLGMTPEVRKRLASRLDLVANSAGLTDFNPDLRDALATNVDSVAHLIDFVRECDHAGMLHLSTCYVVGARDGRVPETLGPNYTPAHVPGFDAEKELREMHELVETTDARSRTQAVTEELRRHVMEKRGDRELSSGSLETQIQKQRVRWVRSHLTRLGTRRAKELGWPNTYTFTKSLGESLIVNRAADLAVAVIRPSIVESSLEEPFRGWNEGINTSAPLSYLLGTYFRQLPSNERKCLDVIPVDTVCRGMTLIAAAVIERRNEQLYHLATSAVNPCDMRRSIELTGLAHRKYYRGQDGFEAWLRTKFDTIPVSKERYQMFSAPRQRAVIQALQRTTPLSFLGPPLAKRERLLDRVEKIIELYEPFILHNDHVFEADNVERLSYALPVEEREAFGYDVRSLDWWEYWINIHIPAQRKWSYPLIEGRPLEARPLRDLHLVEENGVPRAAAEDADKPVATWPSS